jgi:hypothetical protein
MFDLRSLEHSTIIYEPSEKNDKCSSNVLNDKPCSLLILSCSSIKSEEHVSNDRPTNHVLRPSSPPSSW